MNRRLIISLILSSFAIVQAFTLEKDESQIAELEWLIGYHSKKETKPMEWYPAKVPGAVQLDFARAKKWEDHNYAENWKDYRWMEDVYWTYKTSFSSPDLEANKRIYFVSKGIDYEFEIIFNGKQVFAQEGMFKAVDLDLTDLLSKQNLLEIRIFPVPKVPGRKDDRSQAAQCVKPAVSYGRDWHPRLIPSGIWDDTYLELRKVSHFQDVFIDYQLSDDFQNAEINLQVEGINIDDKNYEWILTDSEGIRVFEEKGKVNNLDSRSFILEKPRLWWTHDHGLPSLIFIQTDFA